VSSSGSGLGLLEATSGRPWLCVEHRSYNFPLGVGLKVSCLGLAGLATGLG